MPLLSFPKITIITVSYNAVSTIEKTILSVINQTYQNIEYIIVDGGSNDGTVDVIKKYEDKITYWISESDNGIYDAMNKGVTKASGDFLFFLGADDVLLVDISTLIKCMHGNTIFYARIKLRSTGDLWQSKFTKYGLVRNNVPHQCIFYPQIVFQNYMYDTKYKLYADWLLNMQCSYLGIPTKYIDATIVLYNDLGASGSAFDIQFLNDQKLNIKRFFGKGPFLYFVLLGMFRCMRNIVCNK